MNEKNLEYLKDGLKYSGFGEKLNKELEEKIKQQPAEFSLNTSGEFNNGNRKETVEYKLDFRKSNQTDMYFFNRYQATLKGDDPSKDKSQTFYITKNAGITAKEAFNLLSGRAVHKELVNAEDKPYKAWLQLDNTKDQQDNHKVKQFHEAYGYKLDDVLKRYSIKELENDDQKTKLIKSLEKGNTTAVTFSKDGKDEKMFIEANPQYKSLNLYDHRMDKVFQGVEKKETAGQDKSNDKKESVKQEADDDGPDKRQGRRKGVGI